MNKGRYALVGGLIGGSAGQVGFGLRTASSLSSPASLSLDIAAGARPLPATLYVIFVHFDCRPRRHRRQTTSDQKTITMTSLKRAHPVDGTATSLSSKVYVRTTRSGKVQKIVREVYLRQDIPCSSKFCSKCLQDAPVNHQNRRKLSLLQS